MNRLSILFIKKHERSLTKKLYDVTLCNLQGYNKKFFIGQFSSRPKSNSFSSPCRKPPSLFYGLFAGVQP